MERKWLTVGIILLFFATCIVPSIKADGSSCMNKTPPNGVPAIYWNRWPNLPGHYDQFFNVKDIKGLGQTAWGLTSADFNNDGNLDFAASWATVPWTQSTISLFYNDGNGGFQQDDVLTITQPSLRYINDLKAGDFNNDGSLDLLYTYSHDPTIMLLLNDGTNHFESPQLIAELQPIDGRVRANPKLTVNDFDRDGDLDFLVGDNSGAVEFFKNNGTGSFQSVGLYKFGWNTSEGMSVGLASADFDNDHNIDFIVTQLLDMVTDDGRIYLVRNDGSPSCFNQTNYSTIAVLRPLPSFSIGWDHGWGCLCPIDYNGDGKMDFFFSGGDSVYLYMQQDGGIFEYFHTMTLPSPSSGDGGWYEDDLRLGGITTGDFDKDGLEDVILGGVQGVVRIGYNQRMLVDIVNPDRANIYVGNEIKWFMDPIMIYTCIKRATAIVIGGLTVKAKALEPLQKVEFYLDSRLISTDTTPPYEWNWTSFSFGRHVIKAIAYDLNGAYGGTDEAIVWKYF
ncbi:MAG TPA: FG-GAP-like repeat-containing protein [Candidatus Thermoplasmatota archaeon]|nr:FG-GAP-like repeat-containing protein [Candidatus Thermoplasmatota archaeon]